MKTVTKTYTNASLQSTTAGLTIAQRAGIQAVHFNGTQTSNKMNSYTGTYPTYSVNEVSHACFMAGYRIFNSTDISEYMCYASGYIHYRPENDQLSIGRYGETVTFTGTVTFYYI